MSDQTLRKVSIWIGVASAGAIPLVPVAYRWLYGSKVQDQYSCFHNGDWSQPMKLPSALLMMAAIACEVFSYWGLSTVSGRSVFDEMAGMIPLAAAPIGLVFAVGAAVVWWRKRRAEGACKKRPVSQNLTGQ